MKSKSYDSAYFGLSDAKKEGTWTWVTSNKVSYTNWASDEPNGGTNENYGMFYSAYQNGEWNDGDFGSEGTSTFICEWYTVTTRNGSDTVTTPSSDDIYGTSGHDYLANATSRYRIKAGINIFGYAGNDTINNKGRNVYISGGEGHDKINVTGNDKLYGSNGKDTVVGFGDNDTLNITGGSYTRSTVGNDVVFSIGNVYITLKNTKDKTINIETAASYENVADDWISADDNNFTTSANLLSIVDSGAANYSVVVAVWVRAVPIPRRRDNFFNVIKARRPTQNFSSLIT